MSILPDKALKSFGKNLDSLIKSHEKTKGLNKEDVAKELLINVKTLYGYLSGKRSPIFDNLVVIRNYFGVSIDYLLGLSRDIPLEEYIDNDAISKKYGYRITMKKEAVLNFISSKMHWFAIILVALTTQRKTVFPLLRYFNL